MRELLVCPETGGSLSELPLQDAERLLGAVAGLRPRPRGSVAPIGTTPSVLVRADGTAAYPIVDGVPILIPAERLGAHAPAVDVRRAPYAEAYDEMRFYNGSAIDWADRLAASFDGEDETGAHVDDPVTQALRVAALATLPAEELASFPDPPERWLHLRFESAALEDAYRHVAPVTGLRVLQLGGIGLDAVKYALAGAAEVALVSPMLGELRFARVLAERCGVVSRLTCVAGVAEQLPFAEATFDVVFVPGSLHHTSTELAIGECARVLRDGGKFAAVEPWRAPGYGLGTRIFGKREPVRCKPLTRERVAPFFHTFGSPRLIHHGALTRYPLIAFDKLGLGLSHRAVRRVVAADDALCRKTNRSWSGSSVALLAVR